MELKGSVPHLQAPTNCPYTEQDQSSPWPHFLNIHLNLLAPEFGI